MSWMDTLGGLVGQFGGGQGNQSAEQGFEQIAHMLPPGALADGLSAAFRSDQTPPFSQMAGELFGNSGDGQKASMLNELLATAGPMLLAKLTSGGGLSSLSSVLGGALGGSAPQVSAAQAAQVSPEDVQELAKHAEKHDPSIVDKLSEIYSAHPTLIKTLGGAALAIALTKIHDAQTGR
jgi:hypothetical protein